jgi:hypothetical protein
VALRDPTLSVLHWSDSAGRYLDGAGRPATLPARWRRPRGDPPRAPRPAHDRSRARSRRPRQSAPGEDGDRGGQAGCGERAAPGPGRCPGERSANLADRARDVSPQRHRRVDGPSPAAG